MKYLQQTAIALIAASALASAAAAQGGRERHFLDDALKGTTPR
jgi:hypothetical protein